MTPLEKTLKRALRIDGRDYVVTLTPDASFSTKAAFPVGHPRITAHRSGHRQPRP